MEKLQNSCYVELERCGLVEIYHHIPNPDWIPSGMTICS